MKNAHQKNDDWFTTKLDDSFSDEEFIEPNFQYFSKNLLTKKSKSQIVMKKKRIAFLI